MIAAGVLVAAVYVMLLGAAVAAAAMSALGETVRGLYGMIDVPADSESEPALALAAALLDGGARVLQLRMKGAEAAAQLLVRALWRAWCRTRGVAFVVNDRLDVALAIGADGVHLGQDDLPLEAARRLVPPGFVIGISTHNEAQARAAVDSGASYIGFGPVLPDARPSATPIQSSASSSSRASAAYPCPSSPSAASRSTPSPRSPAPAPPPPPSSAPSTAPPTSPPRAPSSPPSRRTQP